MPGPYRCIRLITRAWKNRLLFRLPPKKDYHVCNKIVHVVSITTHTHDRRKSIGKKNEEQIRRERKGRKGNGCMGPRKRKEKDISGVYWRVCHQNGMSRSFSTVYSSTTNDFRYTHRSTDYRPITRLTAGRGCHVSLFWEPLCPASCLLLSEV